MRIAKEEQQKQGTESFEVVQYPSAEEEKQEPPRVQGRLSLGSPIKTAQNFMRLVKREFSSEQPKLQSASSFNQHNDFSPLGLGRQGSSISNTSDGMYN